MRQITDKPDNPHSGDREDQTAESVPDFFPYETLEFHGWLRILKKDGSVATFRRRQRVRFLENDVAVFMDRVWGDGVLFAGYSANDMRILELIATRKGYAVVLALPRRFSKGETFEIETERRIVGGFIEEQSYWEASMAAPTELLNLNISALKSRLIARPEIVGSARGDIEATHRSGLINFQVRQPAMDVRYRLEWAWK